MKHIILAAAAVALSAGVAHADPFAAMYGNTLTITDSGQTAKAFVNQDMTWEEHLANGAVLKGTYAWKDAGTVCFTLTDPAPKPGDAPLCVPMAAHNVGDTWSDKDMAGNPETLALTAGR
jgi:hypothetical protein